MTVIGVPVRLMWCTWNQESRNRLSRNPACAIDKWVQILVMT